MTDIAADLRDLASLLDDGYPYADAPERIRRAANEWERLRALVRQAFEEGCGDGVFLHRYSAGECWDTSESRRALG